MMIVLFELMETTTLLNDKRREYFFEKVIKPSFISKWNKEFKYKERLYTILADLLKRFNYKDDDIWTTILNQIKSEKRIKNMDNFHVLLQCLIWLNNEADSPFRKKIDENILLLKNTVSQNVNRSWKYDVDKADFRTYEELISKREEINHKLVYVHRQNILKKKEIDLSQISKKRMFEYKDLINLSLNETEKNTPREEIIQKIKEITDNEQFDCEGLLNQVSIIYQKRKVEELKRKKKFTPDMSLRELEEHNKIPEATLGGTGATGPAAGAAGAGGSKKKK